MVSVLSPRDILLHPSNPMECLEPESDDPIAAMCSIQDSRDSLRRHKLHIIRQQQQQDMMEDDEDDGLEIEGAPDDEDDELQLRVAPEAMDITGDEVVGDGAANGGDDDGGGGGAVEGDGEDDGEDEEREEDHDEADDLESLQYDYSSDEDDAIKLRPVHEREQIRVEFEELKAAVPRLGVEYELLDRLGTGTFSTVYKARDLLHDDYENQHWLDASSLPEIIPNRLFKPLRPNPSRKRDLVAIKRITVTSAPDRIRNEICIMTDVLGSRNVSQLITAFREKDQVVAVMPYHRDCDFRHLYSTLPIPGWQAYFRCMFRAFRDIHARRIIHRDVKPGNFLFDLKTWNGTLVDFGLAQYMEDYGETRTSGCVHTGPTPDKPHGYPMVLLPEEKAKLFAARSDMRAKRTWPSDRVGYPEHDQRPMSKANRAGTRGFRPPEVLFRCPDQSGAVDVWAAGAILLCFLVGRYPIYIPKDDTDALMELATILGHKRMEKAALLHNRTFISNVPSISPEGMTWTEVVNQLNPGLRSNPLHADYPETIECALDFVERCLHPDPTHRITPRDALYHDFLRDVTVEEDGTVLEEEEDDLCVHAPGRGLCEELHRKDVVTGSWLAQVESEDGPTWRPLAPGEGLCVGHGPCEFHQEVEFLEEHDSETSQ